MPQSNAFYERYRSQYYSFLYPVRTGIYMCIFTLDKPNVSVKWVALPLRVLKVPG
jgi:hypothetical protein